MNEITYECQTCGAKLVYDGVLPAHRLNHRREDSRSCDGTLLEIRPAFKSTFPKMDLVCFNSAFAYEGAANITHLTLDGEKTACGRKDWATSEGRHPNGPDCLKCRVRWDRLPEMERQ